MTITMQDVRLVAGEGKLSAHDVLAACNAIVAQRAGALASPAVSGEREQGAPCESCGKPVEVGQVVLFYDDVGEIHFDCDQPFALDVEQPEDSPPLCVLLGQPMRQVPLAALTPGKDQA